MQHIAKPVCVCPCSNTHCEGGVLCSVEHCHALHPPGAGTSRMQQSVSMQLSPMYVLSVLRSIVSKDIQVYIYSLYIYMHIATI